MLLLRSVFSIRPVPVAFKYAFARCKLGGAGRAARRFIKKSVCNRAKGGYNLAERAPIAIPEQPYPHASTLKWKQLRGGRASTDTERERALESAGEQQAQRTMATACRHPKVRVVSRHDDTEFVECLECGEVFDSEEFRDMEIEDTVGTEDLQDDA